MTRGARAGRRAGVLLLLLAAAVQARPVQSLDALAARAEAFIRSQPGLGDADAVQMSRLDPRLRLPACAAPLEAFSPRGRIGYGSVTIGVRCPTGSHWTVYVTAKVSRVEAVVSLSRSLARGARITREDIRMVPVDLASLPFGYFTDANNVIGMELRQPLRLGRVVTPGTVVRPEVVVHGQRVTLVASNDTARVTVAALALESGAAGERIRVRNLSSRRVVDATVTGPGRVRVDLPQ